MITYYIVIKNSDRYVKITCEDEKTATDVFLFLHPSGFSNITQQKPFGKKLFEVNQRETNN